MLRERIVGSTAFRVSEFRINELTGELKKSNPGVTNYSFYITNDVNNNVVYVAVLVNQEGYIDSIYLISSIKSESQRAFFAKMLEETISSKDIGILGTDYLFRVGPYGLIKTMSTKFCFQ